MRLNKIIITSVMVIALAMGVFFSSVFQVQAKADSIELYHRHNAECEGIDYQMQESTTDGYLRIESEDICHICGAYHHYYRFTCTCSCGASWNTTGHACYRSPYGSGNGPCTNYSIIDCGTMHIHPVTVYICGMTEDSPVGSLRIVADTTKYTDTVSLELQTDCNDDLNVTGVLWNTGDTKTETEADENGTYTCTVTYEQNGFAGEGTLSYEVTNIDTTPPTILSIDADCTEPTNRNVKLQVRALDEQSGLHENAYSWDGINYTDSDELDVYENGEYKVWVRDAVNNVTTEKITVDCIDKKKPELVLTSSTENIEDGACTIYANASDRDSGLADEAYSWDEGVHWGSEDTLDITEGGIYVCMVRDMAGNIIEEMIEIGDEIILNEPEESEKPEEPEESEKPEESEEPKTSDEPTKQENTVPSSVVERKSETASTEPIPMQEDIASSSTNRSSDSKTSEQYIENESYSIEPKKTQEEPKLYAYEKKETILSSVRKPVQGEEIVPSAVPSDNVTKKNSQTAIAIIGITSLLGVLLILYALYWVLCSASIYGKGSTEEQYLGKSPIRYKRGKLCLRITDGMLERSEYPYCKILFPKIFTRIFENKEVVLKFQNKAYPHCVEREIVLSL